MPPVCCAPLLQPLTYAAGCRRPLTNFRACFGRPGEFRALLAAMLLSLQQLSLFFKSHTPCTPVLLCAPFDTRRSEQALPVIVLINKMDRKDAAPFPDLEVRATPPPPPTPRSLTPPNRKCSMTPPVLPTAMREMHRSTAARARAACAAFRPAWRTRRGTRWLPVPPHTSAVCLAHAVRSGGAAVACRANLFVLS